MKAGVLRNSKIDRSLVWLSCLVFVLIFGLSTNVQAVDTVGTPDVWDVDRDPNVNNGLPDSDSVYQAAPAPGLNQGAGAGKPLPGTHIQFFFADDYNPDPGNDTSLHNDSQKDVQFIKDWECNAPKSAPPKNDLVHGLATYVIPDSGPNVGNEFIFGSASKDAPNGTNYLGFWLLVDAEIECDRPAPDQQGEFIGHHMDGDWLLISDYTNGGGVTSFDAYRWNDPNGIPEDGDEVLGFYDDDTGKCLRGGTNSGDPKSHASSASECGPVYTSIDCNPNGGIGTDIICATSNREANSKAGTPADPPPDGTVTALWDVLMNNNPNGDLLPPPTYFEFGISVTKLIEDPPESVLVNGVPVLIPFEGQEFCGGKFMIETRTAANLAQASLKDYILADFRICGDLTIEKITDPPGSSQEFNFDIEDTIGNIDNKIIETVACPKGDDDGSIDDQLKDAECFNIPNLPLGDYFADEVSISSDWNLTNIVCDGGSPTYDATGADITFSVPESITCTFTNTELGSIRIEKSTIGGTGSFDYAAAEPDGGTAISDFARDTSGSNPTVSAAFTNLLPGKTYSFTETVPAGWDATNLSCSGDTNSAVTIDGTDFDDVSIVLAAGEDIVCTFENTKRSMIVIEKETVGGSGTFNFTPVGFSMIGGNSLTTTAAGEGGVDSSTTEVVSGSYSISENGPPAGWSLTSATCDSGETIGSIDVEPGETVTCRFVNTKDGEIVIEKETVGGSGTFNFTPVGFSMTGGNSLTTTAAGEGGVDSSTTAVAPGNYSISENGPPAGWTETSATCDSGETIGSIDVEPGETVICRFVNTKDGEIVIEKETVGGSGTFNFTPVGFSMTGGNSLTTTAAGEGGVDSSTTAVAPGNYSISENGPPAGWTETSATCDSGETIGSIDVEPGETVICRFVNTKDGEIVIEKETVGGSGTFNFTPVGFSMTGGNSLTTTAAGEGGVDSSTTAVAPGNYSISENGPPAGWTETSATCDSGETIGSIDVEPGETVTCRFVNTKDGEIVIEKETVGGSGTFNFTPVGFSMTGGNSLTTTAAGEGGVDSSTTAVAPGNYSISENGPPAGWTETSATCDSGETIGSIDVEPGETVTCRFVNTKDGEIVIEKVTIGDVGGFNYTPVGFSMTGGNSLTTTVEGVPGVVSKSSGFVTPGGGYSITETVPTGWDLTSATCDSGETIGSIDVEPGETVTCRFVNTKDGEIVIEKVTIGDVGGFNYTPVGFSMTGGNSLTTTVEGVPGVVSKSSGFVTPGGGYSITETVPTGWDLTSATCDSGETIGSIDVEPGETVTCRFVNTKDGEIVIEKVTIGDVGGFNYTPVGFSMTGGNSLTTTVEGVPGVVSKSSGFVTPGGGYSITETVPTGWDLTSATCDSGETIGSIDVEPGETVTCRFVNTKDGEIVIEKVTIGDVGGFNYTPVGFSMTGGNSLTTTVEGVPGVVSKSSGFVTPGGGYSITETVPTGWDLTSATCDSGETIGSIDVEPGETVTCRFVNTKDGEIVIEKVTIGDVGGFNYTPVGFSMTGGNSLTTTVEGVPGVVSKSSGFVTPGGGYSITETVPTGWDLTSATCDSGETIGSIDVEPGETVTCRFENTRRGDVDLLKLANGVETTSVFNFTLNGPGGVSESDNTTPVIDFGHPDPLDKWLVANATYTICETGIPAGTTSHWFVNAVELPFVGEKTGSLMEVYNPDDDGGPDPDDLGTRCMDFQVGPGGAIAFEVDNRTPLGDARTPGYWKNWSSCSNGNQFGKAADEYDNDPSGLIDARHYTLDEILTEAYSKTPNPLNAIHAYDTGVWVGDIALDGDTSGNAYDGYLTDGSLPDADCDEAVLVLSSVDQSATKGGKGKAVNHSNDPAYKLGRYLLAFIANQVAGAYQCDLAEDAAEAAQMLLDDIDFDGTGEFLSKKGIQQNNGTTEEAENALYYHGILGQYVENDPGLSCGTVLSPPNP